MKVLGIDSGEKIDKFAMVSIEMTLSFILSQEAI